MDRILSTHAGSLIRPQELLDFLAAMEPGEDYDQAAYERALAEPSPTSSAARPRPESTSSTTGRWARPAGSCTCTSG